eukprot:TRINITY_DN12606_c0_g1_i1.p1 TRINITY_DN12606_c0_g1~~TRINITY_DN12606_c0_g1_i1.p1  ORF type:complete len:134 (-),score=28.85 TRINITY_DN12606_c0_g1_i1:39-440(-)
MTQMVAAMKVTTESDLHLGSRQRHDESKVLAEIMQSQDEVTSSGASPPMTPRLGDSEEERLIRIFGPSGLPKAPGPRHGDDMVIRQRANIIKKQEHSMFTQLCANIFENQETTSSLWFGRTHQNTFQENTLGS